MPAKETIKVRPPRERDRFNDPVGGVPPWQNMRAIVVPRNSQDYEQRGPIVIAGFMLVLGPRDVVVDDSEFEVRGKLHQMDGVVADYGRKKIVYVTRAN